jgi:hypothetical protein
MGRHTNRKCGVLKEVQEKYAEKEFDDIEEGERPEARGEAMSKARGEAKG